MSWWKTSPSTCFGSICFSWSAPKLAPPQHLGTPGAAETSRRVVQRPPFQLWAVMRIVSWEAWLFFGGNDLGGLFQGWLVGQLNSVRWFFMMVGRGPHYVCFFPISLPFVSPVGDGKKSLIMSAVGLTKRVVSGSVGSNGFQRCCSRVNSKVLPASKTHFIAEELNPRANEVGWWASEGGKNPWNRLWDEIMDDPGIVP